MIFLVNQGKTWAQERAGNFLWSPQLDKAGHQNAGYVLMQNVKKGDYILHNKGGKIAAISVAKDDCYTAVQPKEVRDNSGEYKWDDNGFRIDTEYFDFSTPLLTAHLAQWAKLHHHKDSCFQIDGKLKLRYLCNIAEEDARYIINEALKTETNANVKAILYDAINAFALDVDIYDEDDSEAIEALISSQDGIERYSGHLKKSQSMTTTGGSTKEKPKRDPQIAANALSNAKYKCEYDSSDKTFLRKKRLMQLFILQVLRQLANQLQSQWNIMTTISMVH